MLEINTATYTPENFFAGEFPIVTDSDTIKTGTTIRKHTPIVKTADGISEADADSLASLMGISADIPSGDMVVYYLTGEFFADSLILPEGVTIEDLKPAFRKLGIFLK